VVDHFAFAGFDFAAEKRRLDALGIGYREGSIPETGILQLFVTGPDGLTVELQCPPRP
jgi:hypothetical protein